MSWESSGPRRWTRRRRGPLEVLEAAGATGAIRTLCGAWPQARTLIASYGLLRWEFNLRVSALVGFLGGGGLGLKLYNAVQLGFYEQVSTMVLLILLLVVVSDALSDTLRRNWLAPAALRREAARPMYARLARGPADWPPEAPSERSVRADTGGPVVATASVAARAQKRMTPGVTTRRS